MPPCIFEGATDELLHRYGLDGIIDQTAVWLARAAAGELVDMLQGWEPTRRDSAPARIVYDADDVCGQLPTDGGVLCRRMWYAATETRQFGFLVPGDPEPFTQAPNSRYPDMVTGESAILYARAPFNEGLPQVFAEYQPDTVKSLEDLFERAASLGIDTTTLRLAITDYETTSSAAAANVDGKWSRGVYIGVVLAAHRPAPIVGSNRRHVELVPYMLQLQTLDGKVPAVIPATHLQPTSPMLLARTSGHESADLFQHIVLIGCGSIGSKVALHLGRAGFGNITFIDNEDFQPHNAARHALVLDAGSLVHPDKADAMRDAFRSLAHTKASAVVSDAVNLLAGDVASFEAAVTPETRLIVDATASAAVLSASVRSTALDTTVARFCSIKMFARGRVAVSLLEGTGRTPRADDLSAELFARCIADADLRRAMTGDSRSLTPVFVGQNCRSVTMPISDSVLSRGASLLAIQAERWLLHGIPAGGQLGIAVQANDGIGAHWQCHDVGPTIALASTKEADWEVRVLQAVAEEIRTDAAKWGTQETGGALVGTVSHETRTIIIAGVVPAPADSVRERTRFVLGVDGLLESLVATSDFALGYLYFVGTWHSHPQGGSFSFLDISTLAGIAAHRRGAPAVSLVWTPSGFHAAVMRLS